MVACRCFSFARPGRDGKVAFGKDPYSGDWTDTAQLNYWCLVAHQVERRLDAVPGGR